MNDKEREQLQKDLDRNLIQRSQRLSRSETMREPMATAVSHSKTNAQASSVYRECKG